MDMQIDSQLIRTEREKRAWSQSHLANVSGLGLRTIQRIEGTGRAAYESVAAIAASFSMSVAELRVSDESRVGDTSDPQTSVEIQNIAKPEGARWIGTEVSTPAWTIAGVLVAAALIFVLDRPFSDNTRANSEDSETQRMELLAQAETQPEGRTRSAPEARQIEPSDRIAVVVQGAPKLSRTVAVAEDGTISIPLAERMTASGKTAEELSGDLEQALAAFIRSPQVSVAVEAE